MPHVPDADVPTPVSAADPQCAARTDPVARPDGELAPAPVAEVVAGWSSEAAIADAAIRRALAAADHPWELECPPGWDALDAVDRFLTLVRDVNQIVGEECEAELWPTIRSATFHGELVLPPATLRADGFAVVRASNFGDLVAVLNDEAVVRADVLAAVRRRLGRSFYKVVPAAALRRPYDGHHRGTRQFATWRDRLFGHL